MKKKSKRFKELLKKSKDFKSKDMKEILEQIKNMTPEQRKQLKQGDGSSSDEFDYSQVQVGNSTLGSAASTIFNKANALDPTIPKQLVLDPNLMGVGGNASGFNSVYKY